ncbi:hypothetical protein BCR42DRAFT_443215 [Absidia repens]|uniref:Heterokaryon incompatibility domain-containing protein n=1 Tax=Absidia repens TaxID=90262 RepID=A0A1X2I051_9FUNG|nr:hypothetical protein BCR42DRAFT_443215 [Absidia repens]
MTKDNPGEHQEPASDNILQQQQQQRPFQVVLVDIEKAAKDQEIHCVEKSLEGTVEELNFVALSYRWGEVQETVIDTHLGYLATITSFHLDDFFMLCDMMIRESNLQHIKYVWVDAICVDQDNYERRKATIHQMSNIYNKATYILAVPDLHMRHLLNVSMENEKIIQNSQNFNEYIYHLIQGNADQLHRLDNTFLDDIDVPSDPELRQLLTKYTVYFADGFTKPQKHYRFYDPEEVLEHLYEVNQTSLTRSQSLLRQDDDDDDDDDHKRNQTQIGGGNKPLKDLHHCNKMACPLDFHDEQPPQWRTDMVMPKKPWTHRIVKRNNAIRQKNNLKYWFLQLSDSSFSSFFTFDFTDPAFASDIPSAIYISPDEDYDRNPIHLQFHRLIIDRLTGLTFFEMMLQSRAMDRFYAILPQSKYKSNITQVAHWEINALLSVKLRLYEIMDTVDKWHLLFLSGDFLSVPSDALPTFATSTIDWASIVYHDDSEDPSSNYDMNKESTSITLHYHHHKDQAKDSDSSLYYLQLTPLEYYVVRQPYDSCDCPSVSRKTKLLCHSLQLDEDSLTVDIVCIPYYAGKKMLQEDTFQYNLFLAGSFIENKWIITKEIQSTAVPNWESHDNSDSSTNFNIY